MKILCDRALLLLLHHAGRRAVFYDGFDYTTGVKLAPRNDTIGTPNPGQLNVDYGFNWRYAGAGAAANEARASRAALLAIRVCRHRLATARLTIRR